jgi:hypothetical protein
LVGFSFAEGYDALKFSRDLAKYVHSIANIKKSQGSAPSKSNNSPSNQPKKVVTKKKEEPSSSSGGGFFSSLGSLFGGGSRVKPKISGPSNVSHESGFGNYFGGDGDKIPDEWKEIFKKAGLTDEQIKDKKTAKLIMKTVAAAEVESSQNSNSNVEEPSNSGKKGPPPKPQPMKTTGGPPGPTGGPPGPPGPPPPSSGSGEKKFKIEEKQPVQSSSGGAGRGDLLSQIQQGTSLKKVDRDEVNNKVKNLTETQKDDLASKIAGALANRRGDIEGSDDDDDDDW